MLSLFNSGKGPKSRVREEKNNGNNPAGDNLLTRLLISEMDRRQSPSSGMCGGSVGRSGAGDLQTSYWRGVRQGVF